jgi:hypothetical protein
VRPVRSRLRGVYVVSGQPYSDKALSAAILALEGDAHHDFAEWALDAAHDREALGLDASVCARTFLNEIVGKLHVRAALDGWDADWVADALCREFGDRS